MVRSIVLQQRVDEVVYSTRTKYSEARNTAELRSEGVLSTVFCTGL